MKRFYFPLRTVPTIFVLVIVILVIPDINLAAEPITEKSFSTIDRLNS